MRRITSIASLLFLSQLSFSQIITTYAGSGLSGCDGTGTSATSARITDPLGCRFDRHGSLYFANQQCHTICKVNPSGGFIVVAGTGSPGFSGDGGPATDATFNYPNDIAFDTFGNIIISDGMNYRIRKINLTTGIVTTIAGNGVAGYNGDGIQGTAAKINGVNGLCCDKQNNLYLSDANNHRIRKINAATGVITTIAGNGIAGYSGDSGPATNAQIYAPFDLAIDSYDNIYFPDASNKRIRKIDITSTITTIAGTGYTGIKGDGIDASSAYISPYKIAISKTGRIYFADSNRIRSINPANQIVTISGNGAAGYNGDGILAVSAMLSAPSGIAVDTCGNVVFGDVGNNRIRKIAFNPDCLPISVQDVTGSETISATLYPNPATETLAITAGVEIETVSVMNAIGQVVKTADGRRRRQIPLDVSELPPGVYMVRVNEVWVGKMVKQ